MVWHHQIPQTQNPHTFYEFISLTGLDYDEVTSALTYELVIQVSDGVHSTEATVRITVEPVNEYPPTFTPADVTFSEDEDIAPGTLIGTMTADDKDASPDDVQSYSIDRGQRVQDLPDPFSQFSAFRLHRSHSFCNRK